jgi:hypothetical protein
MTTSSVAKKEDRTEKVLLDWSSMKPYGDVRAPFSMHYKTGLISCPIDPSRIYEFTPDQARPEIVSRKAESLAEFFKMSKCEPAKLLHAIKD